MTINKIITLFCLFLVTQFASLSAEENSIGYFDAIKSEAAPAAGKIYYLRHGLMFEKGVHKTTNYWRGTFVPINTPVVLVSLKRNSMELRMEKTGEQFTVENIKDYSTKSMDQIARNMLTQNPVPIKKFGEAMAKRIVSGELQLGMTKEQVVMTRGYPPGHKTPSLDADRWQYWSSRFVVITYVFSDGILTAGRDL